MRYPVVQKMDMLTWRARYTRTPSSMTAKRRKENTTRHDVVKQLQSSTNTKPLAPVRDGHQDKQINSGYRRREPEPSIPFKRSNVHGP